MVTLGERTDESELSEGTRLSPLEGGACTRHPA